MFTVVIDGFPKEGDEVRYRVGAVPGVGDRLLLEGGVQVVRAVTWYPRAPSDPVEYEELEASVLVERERDFSPDDYRIESV